MELLKRLMGKRNSYCGDLGVEMKDIPKDMVNSIKSEYPNISDKDLLTKAKFKMAFLQNKLHLCNEATLASILIDESGVKFPDPYDKLYKRILQDHIVKNIKKSVRHGLTGDKLVKSARSICTREFIEQNIINLNISLETLRKKGATEEDLKPIVDSQLQSIAVILTEGFIITNQDWFKRKEDALSTSPNNLTLNSFGNFYQFKNNAIEAREKGREPLCVNSIKKYQKDYLLAWSESEKLFGGSYRKTSKRRRNRSKKTLKRK